MRLSAWRVALAAALAVTPAAASFSVSPQSVVLELPAGARRRLEFEVVNESPEARVLRWYPAPFRQKRNGGYEIIAEPDTLRSCHDWFGLDTAQTELGAGKGQTITVDLAVPRGVQGTRYGAIVFDLLPKDASGSFSSVGLLLRMPAFVEVTVNGARLRSRAQLAALEVVPPTRLGPVFVERLPTDALGIVATVRNTGPVRYPVRGSAVLREPGGRRIRTVPLGRGIVLPGAEVELVSVIPPLRPGRYRVDVAVDCGSGSPVKGSVGFTAGSVPSSGAAVTAGQLDLTPSPERVEIELPPRSVRTRYVVLRNEGDDSLRVRAALSGLAGTRDGSFEQSDDAGGALDCRAWTTLEPTEAVLGPRASQPVKLTFAPPAGASGGRYGCLYVEHADSAAHGDGAPAPSLTVPILLTVDGEYARSANIVEVGGDPRSGLAVRLANTGAVHLEPRARAAIKRLKRPDPLSEFDYELAGTVELDPGTVLPADTVVLTGRYNRALDRGDYLFEVIVDCGAGLRLTSSSRFSQP